MNVIFAHIYLAILLTYKHSKQESHDEKHNKTYHRYYHNFPFFVIFHQHLTFESLFWLQFFQHSSIILHCSLGARHKLWLRTDRSYGFYNKITFNSNDYKTHTRLRIIKHWVIFHFSGHCSGTPRLLAYNYQMFYSCYHSGSSLPVIPPCPLCRCLMISGVPHRPIRPVLHQQLCQG